MINFRLNELHKTSIPSNVIPRDAFIRLYATLENKQLKDAIIGEIGLLGDEANPWSQWKTNKYNHEGTTYSGKWMTRFSKYMKINHQVDIDSQTAGIMGDILGQFQQAINYYWVVSKEFTWSPGDFGERNNKSCWWNEYKTSRYGLMSLDEGYSIRFFKDEAQYTETGGAVGIARCWMYNGRDTAIFNAYGLKLSDMATAITAEYNLPNHKVTVVSKGAYINAGNKDNYENGAVQGGGNEGLGFIFQTENVPTSHKLYLPDFAKETTCKECRKTVNTLSIQLMENKHLMCNNCTKKNYKRCSLCGKYHPRDEKMEKVYYPSENRNVYACSACYDRITRKKRYHICTVHGLTTEVTMKIWHTNRRYCAECRHNDRRAIQCESCYRYTDDYVEIRIGDRHFLVCRHCSNIREETAHGYSRLSPARA